MRGWAPACAGWVAVLSVAGATLACADPFAAGDLWDRPAQSDVRDAHTMVVGAGNGVTFRGDGLVVFPPHMAMSLSLQTQSGALPASLEVLQVNGVTYERSDSDQKWARSSTAPPDPTWQDATDPHLLGQERIAGADTWHLRASRGEAPVDLWVRTSDGYPLRLLTRNRAGITFTFTFDRFNSGGQLDAPAVLDVKPEARSLRGGVAQPLTLHTARITVLSYEGDAAAEGDFVQPQAGNRFVVVEVLVENVSHDPLSTFFDWRLTDRGGFGWDQAMPVREPRFEGGELDPGASAQGYLTYEVSRPASGLTLTVKVDDDTAAFILS